MRKTRGQHTRTLDHPPRSLFSRLKRLILWCSGCLFVAGVVAAYTTMRDPLSSRTGQALSWSAGKVLTPLLEQIPWWWRLGGIMLLIYLWWRHKLIMSVVVALGVGVYLAAL